MHAVKGGWLFFGAAYAWMMMTPYFIYFFSALPPCLQIPTVWREVEGGVVLS